MFMSTTLDDRLRLYKKLSKKRAFVYEIDEKLYAVNGNRIIEIQGGYNKCHYGIYKRLLASHYSKESICKSMGKLSVVARSECEYDAMKLAPFIKNSNICALEQLEEGIVQFDSNYKKYCCLA